MLSATPTLAVPSAPSKIQSHRTSLPWPDHDVEIVAFRLHAANASEPAARAFLTHLASIGIRRLRPYVDRISDADLADYLDRCEEAATAAARPRRRGDIQFLRTPARWPWRTSTNQRVGGGRDG